MRILAIETSCDETACAIVENGWKVHANVIASSLDLHKKTGGVVPEVAARAHVEAIMPVISSAMKEAQNPKSKIQKSIAKVAKLLNFEFCALDFESIDAIAVTVEPGLQTSLLVGIETAKWLSYLWKKPLIEVNHIRGHVYANWLERDPKKEPIQFPVMCLSVSGGHNELILMRSHDDWEVVGESQDDAAGEAFDKVARILGLGYPGGPVIEAMAEKKTPTSFKRGIAPCDDGEEVLGSPCKGFEVKEGKALKFPRAWLNQNRSNKWDGTSYNFSFSGLKSEVLREVQRRGELTEEDQKEIAAAFQEAVCEVLVTKLIGAAKKYEVKEIHLAGGVSANKYLRNMIQDSLPTEGEDGLPRLRVRWPKKMEYCTDNAAMIGAAGFFKK
ncbi:MAG: tRNA (adenosine(37)-N6)-threonylcarbamoyltransferase complex transferase subunit TsaD [Candidatus Gracilibacteria bacterium]|nr:tRNA (adenosine(37)-N6)-threonylcarbamoyltransferase complex transferase subunit TsaD [Candidatus Gracilibacteria bacterium]